MKRYQLLLVMTPRYRWKVQPFVFASLSVEVWGFYELSLLPWLYEIHYSSSKDPLFRSEVKPLPLVTRHGDHSSVGLD